MFPEEVCPLPANSNPIETRISNSFPKIERLSGKVNFSRLYLHGQAIQYQILRIQFLWIDQPQSQIDVPIRTAVAVSKKLFKKAHDRNYIKRRLKEAWRLQQSEVKLQVPENKQLHLLILFTGKILPDFHTLSEGLKKIISKLPYPGPQNNDQTSE